MGLVRTPRRLPKRHVLLPLGRLRRQGVLPALPLAPPRRQRVGSLLPLRPGVGQLGLPLLDGGAGGVGLGAAVGELPLGLRKLCLGARALARQLGHAAIVSGLRVGKLLLVLGDGRSRLVQLALRVVELLLGIGPLALVVGALLVELLLGVGTQPVYAGLLARGGEGLYAVLHLVHALEVGVASRELARRPRHRDEGLRVGQILREIRFRHVHELLHRARPERGGAHGRGRHVVRGVHVAHHLVRARGQHVVHVLRALGDLHRVADLRGRVHHLVGRQHALALAHRPRALHEDGPVQVVGGVGDRVHAVARVAFRSGGGQRVHADGVLLVVHRGHDVRLVGAHDLRDALHAAQGGQVAVGEAERRHHADVHEVRAVVELVGRELHVGGRHAQPRVESRAQRHDAGDGQEAPERVRDGAEDVLVECAPQARSPTTPGRRPTAGPR